MRNIDAVMRHEGDQQRLVEDILSSLHRATGENEDYVETFQGLAVDILDKLGTPQIYIDGHERSPFLADVILPPIVEFTKDEESHIERRCLLGMVLQKLVDSVRARLQSGYSRKVLKIS